MPPPTIALHIRRGDFRELRAGESFETVGGVRTPDDYFLTQIRLMRSAAGTDLPITVFSDASPAELGPFLALPNTIKSNTPNDILDLLSMSKAQIIVCSAQSTFSEWASYLSDAIVVRHPAHIHGAIRPVAEFGDREVAAPSNVEQWSALLEKYGNSAHSPT